MKRVRNAALIVVVFAAGMLYQGVRQLSQTQTDLASEYAVNQITVTPKLQEITTKPESVHKKQLQVEPYVH
jgi:hypothetical protein